MSNIVQLGDIRQYKGLPLKMIHNLTPKNIKYIFICQKIVLLFFIATVTMLGSYQTLTVEPVLG